jgi:hypothetical protein
VLIAFSISGKADLFISIHIAHAVGRISTKKKNGKEVTSELNLRIIMIILRMPFDLS